MKNKERKMKCPYCRQEIGLGEKVCPHCGKSLKAINIIAGIFVAIIFLAIIISAAKGGFGSSNTSLLNEIEEKIGVTEENAKTINDTFISIGLEDFDSITHDDILDDTEADNSKGYRIKTSFSDNVILYMDSENKIISIRWADKDFYKDGKVLLDFEDFTMTFDEQSNYNIDAQERVEKILKAPSTAKFPSITKWNFSKSNGVVTLQAYVDSENSYGAMIRSNFQIKYAKDGTIISFIFDGEELIK